MVSVEEAKQTLSYKKIDPLPKNESEKFPVLYVFRHGQSQDNADFIFSGWRDSKLTQTGIKQAEILSEKLKAKKIDFLISSPQTRATETMKIAFSKNPSAKNLEIHLDDRIKERSYGELQGTSKLELFLKSPEVLNEYRRSYTKRAKSGESLEDVVKRVTSFCDDLVKQMSSSKINVAVSCHGNSMRGFRMYFEGLSIDQTCAIETPLGQDFASYIVQ